MDFDFDYSNITIPFGKYKGSKVSDLPDGYLSWLLDQEWIHKNALLYGAARGEWEKRKGGGKKNG